jgi:hypothetical protein
VNWCTLGLRRTRSFPINVSESERSNAGDFGITLSHLGPVPGYRKYYVNHIEVHASCEFCVTTVPADEYDTRKKEVDHRLVSTCVAWFNASRLWHLSENTTSMRAGGLRYIV